MEQRLDLAKLASTICLFILLKQASSLTFSLSSEALNETYIYLERYASYVKGGLSLTQMDRPTHSVGRAFYRDAVRLLDPQSKRVVSFETEFVFKIEGGQWQGDGMMFLISPSKSIPGNAGGGRLGFNSNSSDGDPSNHLFGVEFDTYQNPEFNDSYWSHVGVDINSVNSTAIKEFRKDSIINLWKNLTLLARIKYDGDAQKLSIWLAENGSSLGDTIQNTSLNLQNVFLPTMYLGLSAATGDSSQRHYVYYWSFTSIDPPPSRSNHLFKKIGIPMLAMLAVIIAGAIFTLWRCRAGRKQKPFVINQLTNFTYKELYQATKGFSLKEVIGEGGSCKVYRGYLTGTCSYVAVKLLSGAPKHVEAQFLAELSIISAIRHQNLVGLRGWCHEKGKLLLAYEFMSNGSLDRFIFSKEPAKVLTWEQRYEIVKNVAEAISYLHYGLERKIVHRDIKAANVLLNENFVAKLGDFGFAKLLEQTKGAQSMTMVGTKGYISPELAYTGRATERSDVYSFGILALEIVAGKRAVDFSVIDSESFNLLDWVWRMYECNELDKVVDEKMVEIPTEKALGVLKMGLACTLPDANERPSMRMCCQILNGDMESPDLPELRPRAVAIDWFPNVSSRSTSSTSRLFSSEISSEFVKLP